MKNQELRRIMLLVVLLTSLFRVISGETSKILMNLLHQSHMWKLDETKRKIVFVSKCKEVQTSQIEEEVSLHFHGLDIAYSQIIYK